MADAQRRTAVPGPPPAQGLYDPAHEHDACGVGFVVDIKGRKSHAIVSQALQVLINLLHRGACGCEVNTGDGAGILVQMPDRFLRKHADRLGFDLPAPGEYGAGLVFLPRDPGQREAVERLFEQTVTAEGQRVLGWRDVPTDDRLLGATAVAVEPVFRQIFIGRGPALAGLPDAHARFERTLYVIRKRVENAVDRLDLSERKFFYIPSLSSNTLIYKGMLIADQLEAMYPDLADPDLESALALVHQRFSTNTFPSWPLAHPYRYIAHNGEINTLRGNVNWMNARQSVLRSPLFGDDLKRLSPIIAPNGSDSANFDNAVELLLQAGRSLPHVMSILIPEAWAGNPHMKAEKRAYYEYHASLMEPWDGPAAIAFTDGRVVGAALDRHGLRPARYIVTDDDHLIMASEAGVLPVPEEKITRKWRLQPGKMLLIDLEQGRIVDDDEIKRKLAAEHPYAGWLEATQFKLHELPDLAEEHEEEFSRATVPARPNDPTTQLRQQQAFGYTQEDIQFFLEPMARDADDPVGSMGTDTTIAALSNKPKLLYNYFKQNFAQVTNPPIDPIREQLVMSL